MRQDTLDHQRILLNYQWDSRALLSLVLVGLSSTSASSWAAIARCTRAPAPPPVFASDASALLHEATGGAMRQLDRLAAAALTPHKSSSAARRCAAEGGSRLGG